MTGSTPRSTTRGHLWPARDHRGGCLFGVGVNYLLVFCDFFFARLTLGESAMRVSALSSCVLGVALLPPACGGVLVLHLARSVSSTRPLADSCRATCRIKVTESPWRMSSRACDLGHPWRSAVTRLVTSKSTAFTGEPRLPSESPRANGERGESPTYPFGAPAVVSHPGQGCTPGHVREHPVQSVVHAERALVATQC